MSDSILGRAPEILEALTITRNTLIDHGCVISTRSVDRAADLIRALQSELERVTKERDAAVSDISLLGNCCACKKYPGKGVRCKSAGSCHFEWRGVKEEDEGNGNDGTAE